ncbi:hypothetical protein SAMN05444358_12012 [Ruegeria halocynthiae]|uniref:Uncharacterized protein n=1 Tax=Ruegeria halocynthiae TaxID=985054 RepID=A0A1H3FZG3_9RHOB|nr:hypothetical protein SAMN05444358_12012 [Ruegeria halocynthiae]
MKGTCLGWPRLSFGNARSLWNDFHFQRKRAIYLAEMSIYPGLALKLYVPHLYRAIYAIPMGENTPPNKRFTVTVSRGEAG